MLNKEIIQIEIFLCVLNAQTTSVLLIDFFIFALARIIYVITHLPTLSLRKDSCKEA